MAIGDWRLAVIAVHLGVRVDLVALPRPLHHANLGLVVVWTRGTSHHLLLGLHYTNGTPHNYMRTTIGRRRCVYASMLLLLLLLFIVAGVWVSGRRDVFVVCCVLLAFAACADFSITFECSAAKVQIQSLLRLLLLRLGSLYTMNSKCCPVVDNRQMTAVLQLALHLLFLLHILLPLYVHTCKMQPQDETVDESNRRLICYIEAATGAAATAVDRRCC